jgi:hypothetical protein
VDPVLLSAFTLAVIVRFARISEGFEFAAFTVLTGMKTSRLKDGSRVAIKHVTIKPVKRRMNFFQEPILCMGINKNSAPRIK